MCDSQLTGGTSGTNSFLGIKVHRGKNFRQVMVCYCNWGYLLSLSKGELCILFKRRASSRVFLNSISLFRILYYNSVLFVHDSDFVIKSFSFHLFYCVQESGAFKGLVS